MAEILARRPLKGSGPVFSRPRTGSAAEVCPICRNWALALPQLAAQAVELKVDFFNIAESSDLEQCRYCHAIHQALIALDAQINLDGYTALTITSRRGSPFHVQWDDKISGRTCGEVYCLEGQPAQMLLCSCVPNTHAIVLIISRRPRLPARRVGGGARHSRGSEL
jgi:hypothetical protein